MLLAPAGAFGLVLVVMWALLAWYVVETPRELLARQRQEQATAVRAVAMQTEPVLRQAESALRAIDIWLTHSHEGHVLDEPALAQLADSLRSGTRQFVDIALVTSTGRVRRLQAGAADDSASVAGTAAFDQAMATSPDGLLVGLPLRLSGRLDDNRVRLPLFLRLSRPLGDHVLALALVDLQRLQEAQALFLPNSETALVVMRSDGVALSRRPEVAGFVGRNLFEQFPAARRDFSGQEGFYTTTGAATDGRPRVGAFVTLDDFGLKLLLSDTEHAALTRHLRQRTLLLATAAAATLGLLLLARWLGQLQRDARLREAMLQATSNAMPLGLFRTDASGRIVYVNDAYLRVHGLKREDAAWGWTTLVQAEQRDMLIQRWKHLMSTGEPIDMVRKMKRGDDGRIRWIALRTAPLFINGQVAGQVGTVEDVTERGEQAKAHQTLAAIFDMTPDLVCQASEHGQVTYLNPAARQRLGMDAAAALTDVHIVDFFTPQQLEAYEQQVLPQALRDGHWRGRVELQLADTQVPMDCLVTAHVDVRGRIETVSVILRDVSEQQRAQRQLERSEAMLLAVAHTARAEFLVADTDARVLFFNAAFAEHRRIELQDWVGRSLAELFGERAYASRSALVTAALAGETKRLELPDSAERDGRRFEAHYAPLRVQSGQIEGLIAIELDVTEARREEERLRRASQTDPLTQLLNRSGFENGARDLLSGTTGQRLALLYLDLDRFKPVNDAHGHPTGDALLKAVALRMRHALRPSDLVARLGGDEFAVLLPQLQHPSDAATVSAKLLAAVSAPYHIGELELSIGLSIGYAVATTGSMTLEALVAEADARLYDAKRAGRGRASGSVL